MTGGMTGVGVDPALGVGMTSETAEGIAVLKGVAGQFILGLSYDTMHSAVLQQDLLCMLKLEASCWHDEHLQMLFAC